MIIDKYTALLLCVFIYCVFFPSCQSDRRPPIERPRDDWVKRSVLDNHPRMLTLALHKDMYVAYHTESGLPYKIWKGGVHWDGASYNNIKTIQPESWGNTYWENDLDELAWKVKTKDSTHIVQPRFKGYLIKNQAITFNYEITWKGQSIQVLEQPEYIANDNQQPCFQQVFYTAGTLKEATLYYGDQFLPFDSKETIFSKVFEPQSELVFKERQITASPEPLWLDRTGCNTCHEMEQKTIGPAYRQIAARYSPDKSNYQLLTEKVKKGGTGSWGNVAMISHPHLAEEDIRRMIIYILSLNPAPEKKEGISAVSETTIKEPLKPGFGAPLEKIHPGYELQTIRPNWFQPRVGGMDFLPDGTLLISTWDSLGAVYALTNVETGDTNLIRIERIAEGLQEPLGLKVVEGDIFVMQKPELTQLIDHNKDGIIDEYKTICNSFGVTDDFHEYAYGLAYKEGHFYVNLGLAMRLMSHEVQHPDRGTTLKISRDGHFEKMLTGLRQPNGIGEGPSGDIFITENQGQWVPACKVIALREGDFHGCQFGTGDRYASLEAVTPAVWLPQHEIGNSPGQPVVIPDGIYKDQLLFGEVTHGGIKRVFLEKINGDWQGAVFRFSQGLEAGINRLVWGPDGALYAGGVGMKGGWSWKEKQFGLQRLVSNGKMAFEMQQVQVTKKGLKITFTEPLAKDWEITLDDLLIQQWRYEATEQYGGPKLDLETLMLEQITLSADRRTVNLNVPERKEQHVLYLLWNSNLKSATGKVLWSGEAWYTMNHIPKENNQSEL